MFNQGVPEERDVDSEGCDSAGQDSAQGNVLTMIWRAPPALLTRRPSGCPFLQGNSPGPPRTGSGLGLSVISPATRWEPRVGGRPSLVARLILASWCSCPAWPPPRRPGWLLAFALGTEMARVMGWRFWDCFTTSCAFHHSLSPALLTDLPWGNKLPC